MSIDPTTALGKVRLRIADVGDLPYLSDVVIQTTLDDNNGNVAATAKTCAMYVLGQLAHKSHRKMAQLEVWGAEAFASYSQFLLMCYQNPAFMDFSPVPYSASAEYSPILDFQRAWNNSFVEGTEAQQLSFMGDLSTNRDTRLGIYGYPYVPV